MKDSTFEVCVSARVTQPWTLWVDWRLDGVKDSNCSYTKFFIEITSITIQQTRRKLFKLPASTHKHHKTTQFLTSLLTPRCSLATLTRVCAHSRHAKSAYCPIIRRWSYWLAVSNDDVVAWAHDTQFCVQILERLHLQDTHSHSPRLRVMTL